LNAFSESLSVAAGLVTEVDPKLAAIVELSLRVSLTATLVAACIGLPSARPLPSA
jgi:tungstate transport system permease protein